MHERLVISLIALLFAGCVGEQPETDAPEAEDEGTQTALSWPQLSSPERTYADGRDDPSFMFCTIQYTSNGDNQALGFGWPTDYPDSGYNLMNEIAAKTPIVIARDENGDPEQVVLKLTDAGLKDFPFIFMSDVGTVGFSIEEIVGLRDYLLQGGFLYVDDFWGTRAWQSWEYEIGQVLPPDEYPIADIPLTHDIFHIVYDLKEVPQVPSIQYWLGTRNGSTSERGKETEEPHLRGIWEKKGRLMVVMSHNTDIADGWEREAKSPEYYAEFSVKKSYPLGINIVTYALRY